MSGPIDDKIRAQINALIQDEIQENINEYLDDKEQIDKLIKEYKKIKKRQRSNLSQIKKLGLVDKHGKSLGGEDVKH